MTRWSPTRSRWRSHRPVLEVLEDRTLLSFLTEAPIPVGQSPNWLATGDFAHNGNLDLIVANRDSDYLSLLTNDGQGNFTPSAIPGVQATHVVVGDFRGTGNLDLVTSDYDTGQMFFLAGNGDGTFQDPVALPDLPGAGIMVAADFNGDGNLDLAVGSPTTNRLSILLGNGDGTFAPPMDVTAATFRAPQALAVADFNSDGIPDLVVSDGRDLFSYVLLGNGDGTFRKSATFPIGRSQNAVVVGDWDNNGTVDVAVTNNAPHPNITVFLGNGDGTFTPDFRHFFFVETFSAVADNFEHNGNLDIIEAHSNNDKPNSGGIKILPGHGDGSFSDGGGYKCGDQPVSMVTGDFNNDGWLDLATANYLDNTVSVLLNGADWGTAPSAGANVLPAVDGLPVQDILHQNGRDAFFAGAPPLTGESGTAAFAPFTQSLGLNGADAQLPVRNPGPSSAPALPPPHWIGTMVRDGGPDVLLDPLSQEPAG
jgi:hypothetical protein